MDFVLAVVFFEVFFFDDDFFDVDVFFESASFFGCFEELRLGLLVEVGVAPGCQTPGVPEPEACGHVSIRRSPVSERS